MSPNFVFHEILLFNFPHLKLTCGTVNFYSTLSTLSLVYPKRCTEALPNRECEKTNKGTQAKPTHLWRQQCEKWQKSIQHFDLSPLKVVVRNGWLKNGGSLYMEEQPDNWRAQHLILLSDGPCCWYRVHAPSRRTRGDRSSTLSDWCFVQCEVSYRKSNRDTFPENHPRKMFLSI